jgi:hypothetical protein
MEQSANLALPYIAPSQAQKHVTHNEAIRALDALVQLSAIDRNLAEPPASPANGVRYLVASEATGAWSGMEGRIAAFQDGVWIFCAPQAGWLCWIGDEGLLLAWTGTDWVEAGGSALAAMRVGINTDTDATNRLAVKSEAILLSHDDITPGSGDHRVNINKSASANTGSVVFQTGWSGRAEFGLTGDDNWHVKVSADGETWRDALIVDGASGSVDFPSGIVGVREKLSANRIYFVRIDGNDTNNGLSDDAGGAFATLQHALDAIGNLDIGTYTVTLLVRAGSHAGGIVKQPLGIGDYVIEGDTAAPSNVTITDSANNRGFWCQSGVRATIQGFRFNTTGNNIDVSGSSQVVLGTMEYAGGGNAVRVSGYSQANYSNGSTVTISGNYTNIYYVDTSYLSTWGSSVIFLGAVSVSVAYTFMNSHASSLQSNTAVTGALAGRRAKIGTNCYVNTQGNGEAYLPGNATSSVGNFSAID